MNVALLIGILLLWFLRTGIAVLFHVYFWQLKEYRVDRFWDYLKTSRARQELFPWLTKLRILLLLLIVPFYFLLLKFSEGLILILFPLIYLLEVLEALRLLSRKRLKRPKLTFKAQIMSSLALLLIIFPVFYFFARQGEDQCYGFCNHGIGFGVFFTLLLFYLTFVLPFEVFLVVLIFKPLTLVSKKRLYKKAAEKITLHKNLTVIGITGSFGKTSTKEFLATILAEKFSVLKTAEHVNSEIGVAQTVLNKLKQEHEIFVVEMGAYKIGEIKTICDMLKPKIGILTGINAQHLSLFGSQENIRKAKFELIQALPEDGLAVLNDYGKDFENFVAAKAKTRGKLLQEKQENHETLERPRVKKVIRHTDRDVDLVKADFSEFTGGIEFNLKNERIKFPLIGAHNFFNLQAAIEVALHLGMSQEEIKRGMKKIRPFRKTMEKTVTKSGRIIIDDSYNANPDGVISALSHLGLYHDRKKIMVMPGMLELGKAAQESHIRVGEKIAEVCDQAIFLNHDFLKYTLEGIEKVKNSGRAHNPNFSYIVEREQEKVFTFLEQAGANSVILFESRGAEQVIEKLKNT